ncbi:MAG: galactokinase [Pseudomonadota bacterium]
MDILKRFEDHFGYPPAGQGSAPGRVNLIGEHVDYNGGTVLPAALPNRVTVALAPNGTNRHTIHSDRFETPVDRDVSDCADGQWSDYAVGALARAQSLGWVAGGIDVSIQSDVPDGAGVSSSAALVTAILRAAMAQADAELDPKEIALTARKVENSYIGVPCGIMDQMAVGLSEHGQALALHSASLETEIIPIPEGWTFVTLHTGIRRALTDGRYKTRAQECASAAATLGATWLCHLTDEQTNRIADLGPVLERRARHVVSEHRRTIWAIGAMKAGDIETFGRLMRESHRSYSEDFEASTPEIDEIVASAVQLGAIGSRLTGGGFGGCFVSLLPTDDAADWTKEILARYPTIRAL